MQSAAVDKAVGETLSILALEDSQRQYYAGMRLRGTIQPNEPLYSDSNQSGRREAWPTCSGTPSFWAGLRGLDGVGVAMRVGVWVGVGDGWEQPGWWIETANFAQSQRNSVSSE